MSGEADAVAAIGAEWADSQSLAAKGLRDFPQTALEADIGHSRGDSTDVSSEEKTEHVSASSHSNSPQADICQLCN